MGEKRLDVVDGGFLLHKVVWPRSNATFNTICDNDVSYVKRHFEKNVVIVFDGYPEDLQTVVLKGWERRRRAAKHRSPEVIVNATAFPPTTQEKFLSNDKNKARLIDILKKALQDSGVVIQQAPVDADSFIVGTAIQEASNHDEVKIIGEDIDLLVILTALGYHLNNVFFKKPGRGRTPEQLYSPASFKYEECSKTYFVLTCLQRMRYNVFNIQRRKIEIHRDSQEKQQFEQSSELVPRGKHSQTLFGSSWRMFPNRIVWRR